MIQRDGKLGMLTITHRTKDYGDRFVVRLHLIGRGTVESMDPPVAVCGSLEEARGAVEEHASSLVRIPPSPGDDPVIVESWV